MVDEVIEIEDIVDGDGLKSWLTDWPMSQGLDENKARQIAVSIAHRAAMRVMPVLWEYTLSDDGRRRELTTWPFLRGLLISGVTARSPNPKNLSRAIERTIHAIADAHDDARSATDIRATGTLAEMDRAARAAIGVTANAATLYANGTGDLSTAATPATAANFADQWATVRSDCTTISSGIDVFSIPLWSDQDNPLADVWTSIKSQVSELEWAFWIKWYDDALAGRSPDWVVLDKMALINSKVWDEGSAAVAAEIEKIEMEAERQRLLQDVGQVRADLDELRIQVAPLIQRSHNNPPELIAEDRNAIDRLEIVWAELDRAEVELAKRSPTASVLKKIGLFLLDACKQTGMYIAKKGDVALNEAATTVGRVGTKLTLFGVFAHLSNTFEHIQSIAIQLVEFAMKFGALLP